MDGTGAPWFVADVAVRDGRVVAVGNLAGRTAGRRIDARGLVVAPGFIDLLGQSEYNVLVDGRAASKITQGITTEVTGEGVSIAPLNQRLIDEDRDTYKKYGVTPDWKTLEGYFQTLEKRGTAINMATFVGSGGLRSYVVGAEKRPVTAKELDAMKALLDQAMREGALGVSSSLQYIPNMYATTEELAALAEVAARYGGAYFTHQRSESSRIDSSLEEVFRDRAGREGPDADLAPEDRVQAELGPDAGDPREDRGRARGGSRRQRQPVSLSPRVERPRRVPPAVDPRGRARSAVEAARGSRDAGPRESGHGAGRRPTGRTSTWAPAVPRA